jgi:hypothetical protein
MPKKIPARCGAKSGEWIPEVRQGYTATSPGVSTPSGVDLSDDPCLATRYKVHQRHSVFIPKSSVIQVKTKNRAQ